MEQDAACGLKPADALLAEAYPGARQRANAARWLAWLAYEMGDAGELSIPLLRSSAPGAWRFLLRERPGGVPGVVSVLFRCAGVLADLFPVLAWSALFFIALAWSRLAELGQAIEDLPRRMDQVVLGQLLPDAADRGVLTRTQGFYRFADPAVRDSLAAAHRARAEALKSRRAARHPQTAAFVRGLEPWRLRLDIAVVWLAYTWMFDRSDSTLRDAIVGLLIACALMARWLIRLAHWAVVSAGRPSRRAAIAMLAAAAATLVAIIAAWGSALAGVIPALLVAGTGLWVFPLVVRMMSGRRVWPPLSYLPDAVAVATLASSTMVLTDQSLLTTGEGAALLLPVAVHGSFRVWRVMNRSGRIAVRAAADLVLSLLLGAELVLFIVWLANLLGMSRAEVSLLRGALRRAGTLADLPWWAWTLSYLILAASIVAAGRWPGRLRTVRRAAGRMHADFLVNTSKRVLTGVHIGLLMVVFVAAVAPVTIVPWLHRQVSARYAVEVQQQLSAEGASAAYAVIGSVSSADAQGSGLRAIVRAVNDIAAGSAGTRSGLARHIGLLQARTLRLPDPPAFRVSADNGPSLGVDLAKLNAEENTADAVTKRAAAVGDSAAAAVASLLSIPGLGDDAVIQIVREYLSGLVEQSPLKDVFAGWSRHVLRTGPPAAETIALPDGTRLREQALEEARADGITINRGAIQARSPEAAAVDVADGTDKALATGHCDICLHVPVRFEPPPEPEPPGLHEIPIPH